MITGVLPVGDVMPSLKSPSPPIRPAVWSSSGQPACDKPSGLTDPAKTSDEEISPVDVAGCSLKHPHSPRHAEPCPPALAGPPPPPGPAPPPPTPNAPPPYPQGLG